MDYRRGNFSLKQKLKVFLTIDTEVWEFYDSISENINSGFWGLVDEGEFGLNFQLESFQKYDLRATFFLEPFFSFHSKDKTLKNAVNKIINSTTTNYTQNLKQ